MNLGCFKKQNSTSSTFRKAEKKQQLSLTSQNFNPENGKLLTPEMRILTKINNTYNREIVAVFFDEASAGIDPAADGRNISYLATDLSYMIEGESKPYNIDVLPYNPDLKLPLMVNAKGKKNDYTMQVSNVNYDTDGIWLWDKELDEYHDILNTSYSFSLDKGEL